HLGRLDEALAALRQALERSPREATLHAALAELLADRGQAGEARAAFQEALRLQPEGEASQSFLLNSFNFDPAMSLDALFEAHQRWGTGPGRPALLGPASDHDGNPDRRLRIGYVSGDFQRHVLAHFIEPIFAHHDSQEVEVFAYSDVALPDLRTA